MRARLSIPETQYIAGLVSLAGVVILRCEMQQVRCVLNSQPSVINLRQYLNAVQLALAHHHPSNVQSP
jgi:hypothetical protein